MGDYADVIVEEILSDLNSRSGFDTGNLDDDVLSDIRITWSDLIRRTVNEHLASMVDERK